MIPEIKKLHIPEITGAARFLPSSGILKISSNNLVYLDVDDGYVHQLFPLLHNMDVKKPDYFGKDLVGAHITVVYPEENKIIRNEDINTIHHFQIKDLFIAEIGKKRYCAISVDPPSLLQLRRKYSLPDLLYFKGYSIGFHITIGVID